jgi:type IV pilus assembly protein PilW
MNHTPAPNRAARQRRAHPRPAGFSLVEVMVSTVIALMATLAIFQSFAVSEGYRRAATSGGDATYAGAMGTYVLDQDIATAGYGLNTAAYLGCQTTGVDMGSGTARQFTFPLAPALIVPSGAPAVPDQITIIASGTSTAPGPTPLSNGLATPAANYLVTNPFGIFAGDLLVIGQPGLPCTIAQATDTPTANAVGNQNTVTHGAGTYRNLGGANVQARYNNPALGLGPAYGAAAVLMDMGAAPIANRYYIANNTLMVDQIIAGQLALPVASNIVQLKALYGRDTAGAGNVTIWDTTTPGTSAQWTAVLAVRIAMVARSAQPEKRNANGACTTTAVAPSANWEDGSTTVLDVSADPNWQCYRYKVFHTTSALRNQIWTPS